jgi:pimeloyl-ACP methyl ester carboxylesterase
VNAPVSRSIEFQTADGLTLRGDAWGDPTSRPVLLLHGGGQTRFAWGGTARALAEHGWYALALDLRGHGESDWAADANYELGRFARDTLEIAGQLSQRPVVVGASLGGLSALLGFAGEAQPFSALVLVDITPRMERRGAEGILAFMRQQVHEGFESLEDAADAIARYLPHRPRPRDHSGLAKNLRRGEDGRWRWHWDPNFVLGDRRPGVDRSHLQLDGAARAIRVPTLLVRGRMSELVSEQTAREFLDLVPHAKYVDVSGAGHMVAGDRNDAFTAAIAGFLGEPGLETR